MYKHKINKKRCVNICGDVIKLTLRLNISKKIVKCDVKSINA